MSANPTLIRLRRRLERSELDHLRQVCADQAARIEALEAELAEANRAADWAGQRAEMFHDLANDLAERTDALIGVTRDGQVGVVHSQAAH